MLTRPELDALIRAAEALHLFVLIETFDAADVAIAKELLATHGGGRAKLLIGVNSRDLTALTVVPGRLEQLVELLPAGIPRVAESGVATAEDAARLARAGYDLALIGSALMTTNDPQHLLAAMIAAGRGAK
jgi:indole-3-glycerol phosphate synthase